jgi:hypothetical protein
MSDKLTEKDILILKTLNNIYIETNNPVGPTAIGLALGKDYFSASAYCTGSIKKLISLGKIIKDGRGTYKPNEFTRIEVDKNEFTN